MKIDLSQFRQTFLQESAEHVMTMEAGLLDLRSAPTDTELLNAIFRSAHSIKGGAGSFGLNNLVRFTHALENLLDQLRSSQVPVTEAAIAALLESVDVLRILLEAGAEGEDAPMPPGAPELVRRMEAFTAPGGAADGDAGHPAAQAEAAPGKPAGGDAKALHSSDLKIYTVELEPARDIFSSGANPIMLIRNLASLGTLGSCRVDTAALPPLKDLDPGLCYLRWTIVLTTEQPEADLREVFEFVEHLAKITISSTPAAAPPAAELAVQPAALAIAPAAAAAKSTALEVVPDAAADGRRVAQRRTAEKKPAGGEASSIRVSTDKVDRLIDLVGELVIAQVMTAQMVEGFTPQCLPKLRDAVAAMERNTRELHERVMAVRMMAVGSVFQRFQRTVYDIAQATGKEIRLEISGEETEIDKSMLEQLGDPLTHLIRNAADHGIEAAGTRLENGKTEEGVIHLRAFHRSGRVVIEVSDDGAGIDQARVYAKAVERGLVTAGTQLSEEQINMLLFEPGFSTRDQVSDLSGRGVGMDVVKRNVQQLNGTVSLASVKGSGSTVSIELPLTLAILDGLLVRVADRTLVLPLLAVVETVSPQAGQVSRVAEQGEVVIIRGESIPLLHLRRFLSISEIANGGISGGAEGDQQRTLVIVVEAGRKKVGLVVDELLGQQQVVVKSLERNLHRVEGLMGATILGDGCVAPIVDVAVIANMDLFSLKTPVSRQSREIMRQTQMQAS